MNFLGNRRIKYFSKAGMLPRTKKYSSLSPTKQNIAEIERREASLQDYRTLHVIMQWKKAS